jgi:hypothetical protein
LDCKGKNKEPANEESLAGSSADDLAVLANNQTALRVAQNQRIPQA